ncbi:Fructokinase [Microbacterium oleivorans]|nr:Fructokinase [Microbacterium oleivorans]
MSSESTPYALFSAGFATVDARLDIDGRVELNAGGTALNVARATAALGHRSGLVGTIGEDPAGKLIRRVLSEDLMNVAGLTLDPEWRTPVLLQVPGRGDHAWRFTCPDCGTRLPKFRPSPPEKLSAILRILPPPRVLLFDRVSRFSLSLAEAWRRQGTFIVFEPAALGREGLFRRALGVSHLVKFSSSRASEFRDALKLAAVPQIETMGAAGVRWRMPHSNQWSEQPSFETPHVVDTAGAGDWTTAGTLAALHRSTPLGQNELSDGSLAEALFEGQRFGAQACTWRGPFAKVDSEIARATFEDFACPRVHA